MALRCPNFPIERAPLGAGVDFHLEVTHLAPAGQFDVEINRLLLSGSACTDPRTAQITRGGQPTSPIHW